MPIVWLAAPAVAVVGLLVLTGIWGGLPWSAVAGLSPTVGVDLVATPSISIFKGTAGNLPNSFWGADVRAYYSLGPVQASAFNASGVQYIRWPGGATADQYNLTANRIYYDNGNYNRCAECHKSKFQVP